MMIASALMLASSSLARAQWLTHTPDNSQPTGIATTATFPASGPAGTVQTSISILTDGFNNGVPGISPNPFTNVTSTFNSYFSLNSGSPGTFDFLSLQSNDTWDFYLVRMNFSGLAGGVLPAGSVIAFLDVDNNEGVQSLTGYDQNGAAYGGAWLQQYIGTGTPPAAFDYENPDGGVNMSLAAPVFLTGGAYDITAQALGDQNSAFQGFTTTQNLKSLSFFYHTSTGSPVLQFNSYGIAIKAVPEPSAYMLFLASACLFAVSAFFIRGARIKEIRSTLQMESRHGFFVRQHFNKNKR